ncbi:MAG TPA: serine hydrolase domain-containing protein [Chloroflexota bacterium]|nr:serine hydrolase domain-containing protein [Chloroflexota bacterium]
MVFLRETLAVDPVDQVISRAIAEGVFPGAVVHIQKGGQVLKRAAYGSSMLYADRHTRLEEPIPATVETIFDLASLTKVVTGTAVMHLMERGLITLDAPVHTYLEPFARRDKRTITVRQLLTHTSGLPSGRPFFRHLHDAATIARAVAHVRPVGRPGEQVIYSDLNFIAAGALVSAIAGMPLDRFLESWLFAPLGLRHTGYRPYGGACRGVAATEYQAGRGMVWGVVHDENAHAMGGVSGHAGLFSTADDLAILSAMLLHEGRHGVTRVLEPTTVREVFSVQTGSLRPERGLGWQGQDPSWMGSMISPRAFGHTGFTGTSILLHLDRQLSVILLTNRVHPRRTGPSLAPVRAAVADAAMSQEGKD